MRYKGSITIFTCLIMTILISLVSTAIYSVSIAGSRFQIAHAADLSLYSLFGQYDRQLQEQYHLLFLDGGFGASGLQISQSHQYLSGQIQENLTRQSLSELAITGYTLATDGGGSVFRDQIVEYMESTLGAQGVQQLLKQTQADQEITDTQKQVRDNIDSQEALASYEQLKAAASQEQEQQEDSQGQQNAEMVNPIETIKNLKKMGILMLTLPDIQAVSQKQIDLNQTVSKRKLQGGMGVVAYSPRADAVSADVLFQEYILKNCRNYLDAAENGGLTYEVEYILQGKNNDIENLKGVINQLLLIRETANILHLMTDPYKKSQLATAAITIASMIGFPQAYQIVEGILMACWAYGESILDVRELMTGGKVALIKDSASWQLSLDNLSRLGEGLDSFRKSSETGIGYTGYLRILLSLKSREDKTMRCMDIIENNIRGLPGKEGFRMDSCIAALEIDLRVKAESGVFQAVRGYGYDM